MQLAAQYYAGGQAAGRPVRWRVTQFPYAWTPAARPGFFYSSDGRFSGRETFRGSPVIEREGQTDAQGSATLVLNPATEPTGQPRSYVVEATVTGADDQTVSTTQRVLALPAVVLGLKTPRYIEHAKSVSPEIIVVGPDGKLVAAADCHGAADQARVAFASAGRRFLPGRAQVRHRSRGQQDLGAQGEKRGAAAARSNVPLDGAGVYVIELETQDRLGTRADGGG